MIFSTKKKKKKPETEAPPSSALTHPRLLVLTLIPEGVLQNLIYYRKDLRHLESGSMADHQRWFISSQGPESYLTLLSLSNPALQPFTPPLPPPPLTLTILWAFKTASGKLNCFLSYKIKTAHCYASVYLLPHPKMCSCPFAEVNQLCFVGISWVLHNLHQQIESVVYSQHYYVFLRDLGQADLLNCVPHL